MSHYIKYMNDYCELFLQVFEQIIQLLTTNLYLLKKKRLPEKIDNRIIVSEIKFRVQQHEKTKNQHIMQNQ